MDFSTEYVIMCEAAKELQEMVEHREITQKDFFAKKEGDEGVGIWLPRQDQLQEMLISIRNGGEENTQEDGGREQVGLLLEDIHGAFVKNPFSFTLEQACLCLMMKEVYYKDWNVVAKLWEVR